MIRIVRKVLTCTFSMFERTVLPVHAPELGLQLVSTKHSSRSSRLSFIAKNSLVDFSRSRFSE
jgi:hypothetical protein